MTYKTIQFEQIMDTTSLQMDLKTDASPGHPGAIFVQLTTACNARCINCPHSFTYGTGHKHKKGVMNEEVWNKIIRDIKSMDYRNQVGLYLHHEPLLYPALFDKIRQINNETSAFAVVSTNGSLLDKNRREQLIASRPRLIHININSADKQQYESMTGLDFERTIRNAKDFIEAARPKIIVEINCPVLPGVDIDRIVKLFQGTKVNAEHWANSRGGLLTAISSKNRGNRFNMVDHCIQPVQNFNILHDGSVILCCNDWGHESKTDFPNIMNQSISEIYNQGLMRIIYQEFRNGNYRRYRMCEKCADEMGFRKASVQNRKHHDIKSEPLDNSQRTANGMNILLATNHLFAFTGSEITLYTVAKFLKEKGHRVTVFAKYTDPGFTGVFKGIAGIFSDLRQMHGHRYDAAYVQHHTVALEVRHRFPDLPIVLASLGVLPFLEQPPIVNLNISRYLAISEEVKANLIKKGVGEADITIFRNIVDSEKFQPHLKPAKTPQSAIIYSYKIDDGKMTAILKACATLGIRCRRIGERPGALHQDAVAGQINKADIVFTLGRGAIETMMCGRIPIIYDYQGGDGMVTPENIHQLMRCNFSGRLHGVAYTVQQLVEEIKKYNPENGILLRSHAKELFDASRNVDALIQILQEARDAFPQKTRKAQESIIGDVVEIINTTKNFTEATLAKSQPSPKNRPITPQAVVKTSLPNQGNVKIDQENIRIRLIAFYLPQYHPIPENDAWWGKGFTEWTNVANAKPLFTGHYQPHLPGELGFYDLRLPEVRKAQAALAREHGIYGFCYYHYWFNGKLLLERPLQEVLKSGEPDFPFCLCWANENWTRTWDGGENHILMEQKYSEEDDLNHIQHLCEIFRDRRHIRVDGKPLFLVYRANLFPDPFKTTSLWREEARKLGIGELYLCRVESFPDEHTDPIKLGFDAAIEFQPDWSLLSSNLRDPLIADLTAYDYEKFVDRMLQKESPPYRRFPCVTPSWDNTPRRKRNSFFFTKFSPFLYRRWLQGVIKKTDDKNSDKNLIFINAWNEWGEGNHLEPDEKFGRAYLEATKNALTSVWTDERSQAVEAHEGIVKLFMAAGKRPEAVFALEKLVESFPGYAPAYNDIGVLYTELGHPDKASAAYEKAVSLDPTNSIFLKNLADFYYVVMKQTEKAIHQYKKALSLNPRDTETLLTMGNVQMECGHYREAMSYYLSVLEIDPSNETAGKMFDVLDAKAQGFVTDDPERILREARSQVRRGQTDKAIEKLERLLQVYPSYFEAHNDLGVLHYGKGNTGKARHHYEKAVSMDRTNATALKNLADLYLAESGQTEDALRLYNEVLARDPDDVETLAALGSVCITLGRFDDAVPFYERILRVEPCNTPAREILEKLNGREG